MPVKPARPCSQPGCPNLTHARFCEAQAKAEDERYRKWQRDPKINRRYGARWRKIRTAYITAHPLCEDCLAAAGTPRRRKSTTSSRWSTAAPMTRPTSAVCVSRATPASRRSTATGGGRPRGSTPTEICATSRHVAPRLRNLKDAHIGADRQTRGNLAALARGLEPLDLYDARTGQRAGPTARKVPESNRVLTLRASSAVPVRDETREVSLCPSGFGFPGDVQVRAKNSELLIRCSGSLRGRCSPASS